MLTQILYYKTQDVGKQCAVYTQFSYETDKGLMRKNRPSRTAYKVALNIVTLGAKQGMEKILPPGIVEATERLLVT